MKIKLPVIDLTDVDDDELENLGIEPDYSSLPCTDTIFYRVDSIRAVDQKHSALCIAGYEWTIKLPLKKLEERIDKARNIIITEN